MAYVGDSNPWNTPKWPFVQRPKRLYEQIIDDENWEAEATSSRYREFVRVPAQAPQNRKRHWFWKHRQSRTATPTQHQEQHDPFDFDLPDHSNWEDVDVPDLDELAAHFESGSRLEHEDRLNLQALTESYDFEEMDWGLENLAFEQPRKPPSARPYPSAFRPLELQELDEPEDIDDSDLDLDDFDFEPQQAAAPPKASPYRVPEAEEPMDLMNAEGLDWGLDDLDLDLDPPDIVAPEAAPASPFLSSEVSDPPGPVGLAESDWTFRPSHSETPEGGTLTFSIGHDIPELQPTVSRPDKSPASTLDLDPPEGEDGDWIDDVLYDWPEDADIAELAKTWLEDDVPFAKAVERLQTERIDGQESLEKATMPEPSGSILTTETLESATEAMRNLENLAPSAEDKARALLEEASISDAEARVNGVNTIVDQIRQQTIMELAKGKKMTCPHCHKTLKPACLELPYENETILVLVCSNCRTVVGTAVKKTSLVQQVLQFAQQWLRG